MVCVWFGSSSYSRLLVVRLILKLKKTWERPLQIFFFRQVAPSAISSMACRRIGPASAGGPGMAQDGLQALGLNGYGWVPMSSWWGNGRAWWAACAQPFPRSCPRDLWPGLKGCSQPLQKASELLRLFRIYITTTAAEQELRGSSTAPQEFWACRKTQQQTPSRPTSTWDQNNLFWGFSSCN